MFIDTQMRDIDLRDAGDFAKQLEDVGFDAVWTFEARQDPFLPLIACANATERLEIGTNIAVALARSPFVTAQVAWDLQQASRGRFHLGLGTQVKAHVVRRFSMPFDHPAARITDYIRCVRAIWETFQNDTPANYEGPFYQYQLITPQLNPGPIEQPDIPIYLAGVNPRMCRAAGEVADGFHVHPMHTIDYLKEVVRPALDEGAKMRGMGVDDLKIQTMCWIIASDDQVEIDDKIAQVRQEIAFYGSTPNYRRLLEFHDYGALGKELSHKMRNGQYDEMPAMVPDALVDMMTVVAKPAAAGAAVRQRYEGLPNCKLNCAMAQFYCRIQKRKSNDRAIVTQTTPGTN
jgi:probable F420-dependent oxidoreductase